MAKRSAKVAATVTRPQWVHQFLVVLTGTQPLVWRRIQVPQTATYWDLHVAIQDAMGWEDMHLHEFRLGIPKDGLGIRVGIDEEDDDVDCPLAFSWEREISEDFGRPYDRPAMTYHYDFGDDWLHGVIHEGTAMPARPFRHALCLAGERACPPEDCGGLSGFADVLHAVAHPEEADADLVAWLPRGYDPARFDPAAVKFSNPRTRLRAMQRG
jgi:hypothetical protein